MPDVPRTRRRLVRRTRQSSKAPSTPGSPAGPHENARRPVKGALTRREAVRSAGASRSSSTLRAALDAPRLTLTRIAEALGVTRETVESWRKGRRRPRPESKVRLAELLFSHARQVSAVAAELKSEAERQQHRTAGASGESLSGGA